jgi:hypothetical protein
MRLGFGSPIMLQNEHDYEPRSAAEFWHAQRWRMRARLLAATLAVSCLIMQPAAAQDRPAKASSAGLSPSYVWFSASVTLLTASLGGVFALRVAAIYEQSQALPAVSPTLPTLRRDAERAEVMADGLFAGAALLGVASVLLAFATDWNYVAPPNTVEWARQGKTGFQLAPTASHDGAGLLLRGALP